jgi:hypothetical protein
LTHLLLTVERWLWLMAALLLLAGLIAYAFS